MPLAPLYLACALVAVPAALSAQDAFEVSAERALLRSQPSTSAPVVRTLLQGAEVVMVKDSSGWARVRFENVTGYMRRVLLTSSAPAPLTRPQPVAVVPERQVETDAVPQPRAVASPPAERVDLSSAAASGARAGAAKSTLGVSLLSGVASMTVPGLGYLGLLFLHTAGPDDIQPSYVQRAGLDGRSPEYVRRWAEGYDRAATSKQRRALLIGSSVGSVLGIIIYKEVLFASAGGSVSF